MLSIGKCSAKMATNYYEQEQGYYTKEQSAADCWQGIGCEQIGLQNGSPIDPADFELLLQGRKVAAFDLTFSADKSLSITAQMTPELERDMMAAHRAAVTATIKRIESEIGTQVWDAQTKAPRHVHTGNVTVAKVEHLTSRALDPDIHTHCVFLNRTFLGGKEYALDAKPLYENKLAYGLEYRRNLAAKLQKQGYVLELTDGEKGLFQISGIREDVREHFSKRRAEIEERLADRGETGGKAADRAEQATRKAKQKGVDIEAQREKWRAELNAMEQEIPEKIMEAQPRNIAEEQQAALNRAVLRLSEKQFAFTPKQLQQAAANEGVLCGLDEKTAQVLINNDPHLLKLTPTKESGLDGHYYTTEKNMTMARDIETMAVAGRGRGYALNADQCKETLTAACAENGWQLGEQQSALVQHVCCCPDKYIAVRGLAGTGKSFSLNAAREVFERNGYEVRGMSATGQAAKELAADANIKDCGTIHHQLNAAEKLAGNAMPGEDYSQKTSWNFAGIQPGAKKTVWFVDEASLTDNNLFYNIEKLAEARGDKVVFVGDDRQMLAVGQGNAFAELVQRGELATCELSNIVRQKDNPELLQAVREAVRGESKASLEIISKDIREVPTRGHRLNAVAREYCALSPEEQSQTLVLTARNADRKALNKKIREKLVKNGRLQPGQELTIRPDEKAAAEKRFFAKGDKIIFLRNDAKMGVMNGSKGVVEKISGDIMTTKVEGKLISFDVKKYAAFDHGYCMTPNKAQGATVKRAIINMSSDQAMSNTKNAFYVDISRAKKEVKLFCDDKEKLSGQISKFARKITAKDFQVKTAPSNPAVRFTGVTEKSGKVAEGAAKAVELPLNALSAIPVIGIAAKVAKIAVRGVGKATKMTLMATKKVATTGLDIAKQFAAQKETSRRIRR